MSWEWWFQLLSVVAKEACLKLVVELFGYDGYKYKSLTLGKVLALKFLIFCCCNISYTEVIYPVTDYTVNIN